MITESYRERNARRQTKIEDATMSLVTYFISLGDDLPTANNKVSGLSTEVAVWIYPYVLGNTQPLLDAINASTLPYMDTAAKEFLTTQLT